MTILEEHLKNEDKIRMKTNELFLNQLRLTVNTKYFGIQFFLRPPKMFLVPQPPFPVKLTSFITLLPFPAEHYPQAGA